MLEYKILLETNPTGIQSFTDHVNRYIADGWEPLSGIQVVISAGHKEYYQTMIRDTQNTRAMVRRFQEARKVGGIGMERWYRDELARGIEPSVEEES